MNVESESGNSRIVDKLKLILSKYYTIELYKEDPCIFEPICVIMIDTVVPPENFDKMQAEFREMGYIVKFHLLDKDELKKFKFTENSRKRRYLVKFEAKLSDPEKSRARSTLAKRVQLVLLACTIGTVGFSAYYYLFFIDGYFGGFQSPPALNAALIAWFCLGMLLIIVLHECGHILMSRKHRLSISAPYLIPGPPPIGMLGAFVSIRDEPHTRNQQFDIALGGIMIGGLASLILVVVGLFMSVQVETSFFLDFRASYFQTTLADQAKFVSEHLNTYNLLFMVIRNAFFDVPSNGNYFGYMLPTRILLLHPLTYAGWIGLIISGLNLIPIPFFDGGHVLRVVFPGPSVKFIGGLIGLVIFVLLNPMLLSLFVLPQLLICCAMYSNLQARLGRNQNEVPNPTVPLTRSRKIIALILIPLFIMLSPLNYLNVIFGFGV